MSIRSPTQMALVSLVLAISVTVLEPQLAPAGPDDTTEPVVIQGPLESHPAWTAVGDLGADFGRSVASAGDVYGDGYDDVIVGAPLLNDRGSGYVHLGSARIES